MLFRSPGNVPICRTPSAATDVLARYSRESFGSEASGASPGDVTDNDDADAFTGIGSGLSFTGPGSGLSPAAFSAPNFGAEFGQFPAATPDAPSWAGVLGISNPSEGIFVSADNPATPGQAAGLMADSINAGGAPSAAPAGIDFGVGPSVGLPAGTPSALSPEAQPSPSDVEGFPTGGITFGGPDVGGPGIVSSGVGEGSVDALSRGILGNAGGALGLPGLTGGITQDRGQGLPGGGGILPDDGGGPIQGEGHLAPIIASLVNRMMEGGQITPEQGQSLFPILSEWAQIIPPDDPRWPQVLQLVQQQMSARAA